MKKSSRAPKNKFNKKTSPMKKIKLFAFCESELHPGVVWYHVKVGISRQDKAADRYLIERARSAMFFYADYSAEICEFRSRVAASLFPGADFPVSYLRTAYINVLDLARFLKKNPPALLNSLRLDPPAPVVLVGTCRSSSGSPCASPLHP